MEASSLKNGIMLLQAILNCMQFRRSVYSYHQILQSSKILDLLSCWSKDKGVQCLFTQSGPVNPELHRELGPTVHNKLSKRSTCRATSATTLQKGVGLLLRTEVDDAKCRG
jgi:hypothetical protein